MSMGGLHGASFVRAQNALGDSLRTFFPLSPSKAPPSDVRWVVVGSCCRRSPTSLWPAMACSSRAQRRLGSCTAGCV